MEKADHKNSLLQGADKYCWVTLAMNVPLEKHHIYFGPGMRKISDKNGFWVWLTPEMHRGTDGVHGKNGHDLDLYLKRTCQTMYEETHSREAWMELIGKNYLEE